MKRKFTTTLASAMAMAIAFMAMPEGNNEVYAAEATNSVIYTDVWSYGFEYCGTDYLTYAQYWFPENQEISREIIDGTTPFGVKVVQNGTKGKEIALEDAEKTVGQRKSNLQLQKADVEYLQALLCGNNPITENDIELYDNGDNCLNLSDLVEVARRYASVPTHFIVSEDGTQMELSEFTKFLDYYSEAGVKEFEVKYGDKAPVKETTTTTTTTTKPTTTTTTTTKPTTTTTTTSKPTTTTTTTTTSTTTTSTTTPTTTTSTTTSTTTTNATTSTTTTSTTTSTTTTNATTSTTTTTTTTSTTTSWQPPAFDDLVDPYGASPTRDEYDGLVETAKLFGLEYYKIIWSEELIPYSLIIPSDDFTSSSDYIGYWASQVCPIEDAETLLSSTSYETSGLHYILWRPFVADDDDCLRQFNRDLGFRWDYANEDWFFDFYYWTIIPCRLDENTGELVEDLRLLYPDAVPNASSNKSTSANSIPSEIPNLPKLYELIKFMALNNKFWDFSRK